MSRAKRKEVEVTPDMIDAGVDILTTEFGMPTECPLTDFPSVARGVYLAMLSKKGDRSHRKSLVQSHHSLVKFD